MDVLCCQHVVVNSGMRDSWITGIRSRGWYEYVHAYMRACVGMWGSALGYRITLSLILTKGKCSAIKKKGGKDNYKRITNDNYFDNTHALSTCPRVLFVSVREKTSAFG